MSAFLASVSPDKARELTERMARLGLRETDLDEQFVRGGGAGGQKINKTSSLVRLRHRPTGLEVRCQAARSQALNRFLARRELCDRLEERRRGAADAARQAREKIRRQKRRRSRRQREHLLQDKKHHAARKAARRTPAAD